MGISSARCKAYPDPDVATEDIMKFLEATTDDPDIAAGERAFTLGEGEEEEEEEEPTVEEVIEVTWDASFNENAYIKAKFGSSCYAPGMPVNIPKRLLDKPVLARRECAQRLPQVITLGVRKCGTGALQHFLTVHPNITGPILEVHFFDTSKTFKTGYDAYLKQMPFTTPYQLTLEKTPAYLFRPHDLPKIISRDMPDTKFIISLCDPVRRAVSDYLEYNRKRTSSLEVFGLHKYIAETFEASIMHREVGLDTLNEIVDLGVYIKHLARWYDYIPRDRIHLVDGGKMSEDPTAELRRIETFLGLQHFFREEHFDFNSERGLHCMNFPRNHCLPLNKGREHPEVDDKVMQELRDYYRPFDRLLAETVRRNFTWMSQH
ncbi:heparan sulfate glucosamine 3-O-sulfotransferase 1-like [Ptychodera flava]|uniref:heparan sulfate glucosamine 3-O-sulfotransferase 1-like n=1 Tax=Ptychodera flava TaxID=63121 RepID=UPI00396A8198